MLDPGKPSFTPKKGKTSVVMFVGLQGTLFIRFISIRVIQKLLIKKKKEKKFLSGSFRNLHIEEFIIIYETVLLGS